MLVRVFNENGIKNFKSILQEVEEGKRNDLPDELITSDELTSIFEIELEIRRRIFTSRALMTLYLINAFKTIPRENLIYNKGLWSWLSAFYFKSVCPQKSNGIRKVGALDRHILNIDHWGRYYRHLLASSFRLYDELVTCQVCNVGIKSYLKRNCYDFLPCHSYRPRTIPA